MRDMRKWLFASTALTAVLLFTSCGSTEVNFERYSLLEDNLFDGTCSNSEVTVKPFGVLNDGSVVLKISDVTLRPAKNHRWSSDLGTQLEMLFKKTLCEKIKTSGTYEYNMELYKFYGDRDGNVSIEVRLSVLDTDGTLLNSKIFSRELHQEGDGYAALVRSLKEGWLLVCEDMANSWQELVSSKKS